MKVFRKRLAALTRSSGKSSKRRFLFVPYDQLSEAVGPLSRESPSELGIIMVECPQKAARRPYHKQKLALVLTNMRHFALEQAARGVEVRYLVAASYAEALQSQNQVGTIRVMRPAERELRVELEPLVREGLLEIVPNEAFLTTRDDFDASCRGDTFRMDAFYRHVRRRLGVLMDARGKPLGGKFSFDAENRKGWNGSPAAPEIPTFSVDAITEEVCDLVRTAMASHPGTLRAEYLPATREDAERSWLWAKRECLQHFGPFEDAMSSLSPNLFHSRLSPLLNLGRLVASRVVTEVVAMDLPLPSQEGFVRQILGWREFVRHVHDVTDGFRTVRGEPQPTRGDPKAALDGGSDASFLGARRHLPEAYWGKESGLRCLDLVIEDVWDDGMSHHITRLMVLSNIATLLDVSPRELTDWFWAAYIDAYDWVVEPNVLGMGTFGVGDLMTTKPYVAGSAYINRMSDFCEGCRFDPKKTCPLTSLYWAFLARHQHRLQHVERMKLPLASERKRSAAQRTHDAEIFERVSRKLASGESLFTD